MEGAGGVGEEWWELGVAQVLGVNGLEVGGGAGEVVGAAARAEDLDGFFEVAADGLDGGGEVGVVGDDDGDVEGVLVGILEEASGEADVGAALLALEDVDVRREAGDGDGEGAAPDAFGGLAAVDGEVGEGGEGAEEGLLVGGGEGIPTMRGDAAGEVVDAGDAAVRVDREAAELGDVEPAVGGVFEAAEVEIEAVDVDAGAEGAGLDHALLDSLPAVAGALSAALGRTQLAVRASLVRGAVSLGHNF